MTKVDMRQEVLPLESALQNSLLMRDASFWMNYVLANCCVTRNSYSLYRELVNINDRIRIAYGWEYGVWLESIPGEYTKTVLRLPITKE